MKLSTKSSTKNIAYNCSFELGLQEIETVLPLYRKSGVSTLEFLT